MRMVLLFLGLVATCLVLLRAIAHAQSEPGPVHAAWSVDDPPEGGWTVGDRIPLRLRATYPAGLTVSLPELPEAWGPFEVLQQSLIKPVGNEDGRLTTVREATVTLWAPGNHQTPALSVRYRGADDQLYEVSVPPLSITVVSVLAEGETEKRDLKPQASLPRPPIWPWILGGLLLTASVGAVGWATLARLRRRAVSSSAPTPVIDPRPPHEIAYSELDRIAALNLPARGELKRHYTLVADCLRAYVQGRYHIPAMDQTTEELLAAFRRAGVDRGHVHLFRELLAEADVVKFAKFFPPIEQAQMTIGQARHIVDVTKLTEEPADGKLDELTGPGTQHAIRST